MCFGLSVLPSTRQSVFVYVSELTSFSDGINTSLSVRPLSNDCPDVSISLLRTSCISGEPYMERCALRLGHFMYRTLVFMQKFMAYLSYMHWLSHVHSLQGFVIFSCLAKPVMVIQICRAIKLRSMRGFMLAHDYHAVWHRLRATRYFTRIFLLLGLLHYFSNLDFRASADPQSVNIAYEPTPARISNVGGGRIPTFSLDELLPHISASAQTFEKLSVFKFKAHNHNRVAHALYGSLSSYMCKHTP